MAGSGRENADSALIAALAGGRVVPTPHGTEVTIRLGMHPIVLGFVAVLTLLVLSAVLVGIALRNPNQPHESLNPVPS